MARVTSLERARVAQLAATLVPELRDRGYVMVSVDELEDVERWRAAAQRAARLLGWSVQTGVTSDGGHVWAYSDDWPVPPGAHREAPSGE